MKPKFKEEVEAINFETKFNLIEELIKRSQDKLWEEKLKQEYYRPLTKVEIKFSKKTKRELQKVIKSFLTHKIVISISNRKTFYPLREYITQTDFETIPMKFRPYIFDIKKIRKQNMYITIINKKLYLVLEASKFWVGKLRWFLQIPDNWKKKDFSNLLHRIFNTKNPQAIFFQPSKWELIRMWFDLGFAKLRHKFYGWRIIWFTTILYTQAIKAYQVGECDVYDTNLALINKVFRVLEQYPSYHWVLEAITKRMDNIRDPFE